MISQKIFILNILFLVVGLGFCLTAIIIRKKMKNFPILAKAASITFYLIGALTFVLGLINLVMKDYFSIRFIEVEILIYLVVLIIAFSIFIGVFSFNGKGEIKGENLRGEIK